MIGIPQAFSTTYAQARVKFLEAAASAGVLTTSHNHPLTGVEGETLAMDVARVGPADADKVLIVSSACHGVEGYCGSGVQVFALHDADWHAEAAKHGVAVVYIHALNPYGFSHCSRTTHENVDLNRNFQDFGNPAKPLPVNSAYVGLHDILVPDQWPPSQDNQAAIGAYIASHGMPAFQAAVSQGQHAYVDGLFFGGIAPTWSNLTLRQVLRQHAGQAKHLGWIDIHTGLGPNGVGERIYAGAHDSASIARAKHWWGQGDNHITSIYDGSSTSAFLTGLLWGSVADECPQAQYTGIAMEYGTVPITDCMQALRGDQWLRRHPELIHSPQGAAIRQTMQDAFYTQTDSWKGQIISQARQAMFQAVQGLGEGA